MEENILADVYDSQTCKDFLKYKGKDYLNTARKLAIAINVDWFQPFKKRNDRFNFILILIILCHANTSKKKKKKKRKRNYRRYKKCMTGE